jgi:hypothetical protein
MLLTTLTMAAQLAANACGSAPDVQSAFAQIVKLRQEVDIQHLGCAFGLPDIIKLGAVKWRGPSAGFEDARFTGTYAPPSSTLGISGIRIEWKSSVGIGSEFVRSLSVGIDEKHCPTLEQISVSTGATVQVLSMPGVDGGPSYPVTFFHVQDAQGSTFTFQYQHNQAAGICSLYAQY